MLVPSARLAELRLSMAAAGLAEDRAASASSCSTKPTWAPPSSPNTSTTAARSKANWSGRSCRWRKSSRRASTSPFPRIPSFWTRSSPPRPACWCKIRPGARLAPQNVLAINHLVASAVEGLSPDAVSVLDMNGNLLGRPTARRTPGWSGAFRGRAGLPPQGGSGPAGQDQLHAGAAAGRGKVPRRRFGGVRFHRRRAERGDLRPGALA